MPGGRFDIVPVLRGHWKGLTDGRTSEYKPDWVARTVLVVPVALVPAGWIWGWKLAAPAALLTGVALLGGTLIGSFTHLSTLRLKVTEWSASHDDDDVLANERDMLDETAAHILTAALLCIADAAVLAIGMNISATSAITGVWAAAAIGLSAYIFLIFLLIVPRLYSAYIEINRVRARLSGFARGRW